MSAVDILDSIFGCGHHDRRSPRIRGLASSAACAALTAALVTSPEANAKVEMIARNCGDTTFSETKKYYKLRDCVDINDSGKVIFCDAEMVYVRDLSATPPVEFVQAVVSQHHIDNDESYWVDCFYDVRINNHDHLAYAASSFQSPEYPCEDYPASVLSENCLAPNCQYLLPDGPIHLFGGFYNPRNPDFFSSLRQYTIVELNGDDVPTWDNHKPIDWSLLSSDAAPLPDTPDLVMIQQTGATAGDSLMRYYDACPNRNAVEIGVSLIAAKGMTLADMPDGTSFERFYSVTSGNHGHPIGVAAAISILNQRDPLKYIPHATYYDTSVEYDEFLMMFRQVGLIDDGCVECADDANGTNGANGANGANSKSMVSWGMGEFFPDSMCLIESNMTLADEAYWRSHSVVLLSTHTAYSTLDQNKIYAPRGRPSASILNSPIPNIDATGKGAVAFIASSGPASNAATESILVCFGESTPWSSHVHRLVKVGDAIPGDTSATFTRFESPRINRQGVIVFTAEDSEGQHGVYMIDLKTHFHASPERRKPKRSQRPSSLPTISTR